MTGAKKRAWRQVMKAALAYGAGGGLWYGLALRLELPSWLWVPIVAVLFITVTVLIALEASTKEPVFTRR